MASESMDYRKEEILIRSALAGDSAAFMQIVEFFQMRVFSLLMRLCHNAELSKDLTQETFLKAFSHLKEFKNTHRLSPWLMKIAHNLLKDHFKPLKRRGEVLFDPSDLKNLMESEICPEQEVISTWETEINHQRLRAALELLPGGYREVILLRFQECMSYGEIAEVLDCPVGTVKTLLFRGKSLLKKFILAQIATEEKKLNSKAP